jgi:general L-amino acid transport system substrate-binding protein
VKSYAGGGCTLLTGDVSLLAHERSRLGRPAEHLLLPELITKEPLGPVVREGDDQWFRIARWTLMALVSAEELGVSSANADQMRASQFQDVRRLLGADQSLGQALGLAEDWVHRMVKQTGNYGEMFERNLGAKSPLRLERGLNALWSKGGLMYAAPFR